MKKILFQDKKNYYQFWLDLNDILIINAEPFYAVTQMEIRLKTGFEIHINKRQNTPRTFGVDDIYRFLKSEDEIQIIKVLGMDIDLKHKSVSFLIADWVKQVMNNEME